MSLNERHHQEPNRNRQGHRNVPALEGESLLGSPSAPEKTVLAILLALSFSHLLNDTMQSLLPAIYPVLKASFHLTFAQIGLITLTNQLTASILQPLVGFYTDRYPKPFSLAIGMGFTLTGLVLLGFAGHFLVILAAAAMVGMGSSVFHPEASRVTRMASGGRHGFAQSLFQVGGNAGTSLGPLLAAWIIVPRGQGSILWFSLIALTGIIILTRVGRWYRSNTHRLTKKAAARRGGATHSSRKVVFALGVLVALVFSKYFYLASMSSYYTFFVIEKFHLSVQTAQYFLFIFLFAVAAGTIIGGPLGDKFGRKKVIWVSILGVAPFTLLLPYANLAECGLLTVAHRRDSRLGVLGDPGLRAGIGAGQRRHDRRPFLRPRLRHGRHRLGRARACWPTTPASTSSSTSARSCRCLAS